MERQRRSYDASEADRAVPNWQVDRFEPPQVHETSAVLEAESCEGAISELLSVINKLRT